MNSTLKTFGLWVLMALFLAGCGGNGSNEVPPVTSGNPPNTAPPAQNQTADAPIGTSVYIPQPVIKDRDNDNIPDAFDEYPDARVRVADPLGAKPLLIDAVYTEIDGRFLDDAALSGRVLTIKGRGFDRPNGDPVLVFIAEFGPQAVIPERINAETWQARAPRGTTRIFAVIGEFRSNDYGVTALTANSPALFRNQSTHFAGNTITLTGLNLQSVDQVTLGGDRLDIVASTAEQLQILLPAAPLDNVLRVQRGALAANPLQLNLRRTIRLRADPQLTLPVGTTVHGYHEGARFDVDPADGVVLETAAHRPIMLYLHLTDRFGETDYGALGTLIWPGDSAARISAERALLAELYEQRRGLPLGHTGDWRRIRERLSLAMNTPEAMAFLGGLQNALLGETFNANTALQQVLDVLRALMINTPEPQYAQLAGSGVYAKDSAQLLGLSPQEILDEIQQWITLYRQGVGPQVGSRGGYLDDPIAWIVTPFDTEKERGEQQTTVDGKLYPGSEFAQFEIAQHGENEFIAPNLDFGDPVCRYPNNAIPPTGAQIWNSDLCVQNSTPMFASVAVYLPDQRTFGVPYPGADANGVLKKTPDLQDLVRQHATDILGPTDTSFANEGIYLEGNLGDWNNFPLCRMRTCYVEILTGGLGLTVGSWEPPEFIGDVTGNIPVPAIGVETSDATERAIISKLRRRSIYASMILPLIAKMTALPSDSMTPGATDEVGNPESAAARCVADIIYKDPNFIKAIDQFVVALGDRKSISLFVLEDFDATLGQYLRDIVTVDAKNKDFMGCLNSLVPELTLKKVIENNLEKVAEQSGWKIFTAILDASLFSGGILMTPEKFMYKIGYRAEITDIFAQVDDDLELVYIDTINGLFTSGSNPRPLIIEGTWIANEAGNGLDTAYYPTIVFRDRRGLTAEYDATNYLQTIDDPYLRKIHIPLIDIKDLLDSLTPGPLEIYVQLNHGGGFPGYKNDFGPNDVLNVPPPFKVDLRGSPRLWAFNRPGLAQGENIIAYGSGLTAFRKPEVSLIPANPGPDESTIDVPATFVTITAGIKGVDDQVEITLPNDAVPQGSFISNYSVYIQDGIDEELFVSSAEDEAFFNILDVGAPVITLADYGQHKDDSMSMTVLDAGRQPIVANLPDPLNGSTSLRPFRQSLPFTVQGSDTEYYVLSMYILQSLLPTQAHYVQVRCDNPGNDNDCTFGISATNEKLCDDEQNEAFISTAGKLKKNDTVTFEFNSTSGCPLVFP